MFVKLNQLKLTNNIKIRSKLMVNNYKIYEII